MPISGQVQQQIEQLLASSAKDRAKVRRLISQGRWREAEPDITRARAVAARRVSAVSPPGAEAIQLGASEFQPASFLTIGSRVRRAVAYVEVNTPTTQELGSGFLVSERLFVTNFHVIRDIDAARCTSVTFDRELDEQRQPIPTTVYRLDPDTFAEFSPDDQLDYAVIALGARIAGDATPAELGCCLLSDRPDKHQLGMPVNIIQHPNGWPKTVAVRNNTLTYRTDTALLYETDTEAGSSGSPVFNDAWELVALHHWGQPHLAAAEANATTLLANEGVRISAIYRDLAGRLANRTVRSHPELLRAALEAGRAAPSPGHVLGPPRPRPGTPEGHTRTATSEGVTMTDNTEPGIVRLNVPIEITIRLAETTTTSSIEPRDVTEMLIAPPSEPLRRLAIAPKTLLSAAEAVKVDLDYSNRSGYRTDFIAGHSVPTPVCKDPELAAQVAALRTEVAGAATGRLDYEHFSLVMHKTRRVAIFTATNIDGPTYLDIDRKTGQVAPSEGDTWFKDTRISNSYYLDQTFYADWSTYFDRGHLTRRSDPTWGTKEQAVRANADTFHFTNCSPQHWKFNESAKLWEGVERYVLENGVLATDTRKRLCVFQGPIYNDTVDRWADDVQIPSAFWKIVVWAGASKLKAVGLVVDQLDVIDLPRRGMQPPVELAAVKVNEFRYPIEIIEQRTGLDFGTAIRNADTIKTKKQPTVGEEAIARLTSFDDLVL